jgi:hypothetical protein
LSSKKWDQELVEKFNKMMLAAPLKINDHTVPDGISYHLADIYLEEMGKFGETLKPIRSVKLLHPFIELLATSTKYDKLVLIILIHSKQLIHQCSCVAIFLKKAVRASCTEKNLRSDNRVLGRGNRSGD